jgi:archaellum component FlaC
MEDGRMIGGLKSMLKKRMENSKEFKERCKQLKKELKTISQDSRLDPYRKKRLNEDSLEFKEFQRIEGEIIREKCPLIYELVKKDMEVVE